MFDNLQMFSSAQVVSADAYSTNSVNIAKTADEGVWIEVIVTAKGAGVSALDVIVLQKDADSGWDYAAVAQKIGFLDMGTGAVNRKFIRVQSKMAYLKLYYNITLTADTVTVTAGIVPGPARDAGA